ncbi:MAG TPA: hypothetical protein VJ868_02460 [Actinomycetota bacterium]|nr:hypothetical protein [Actinomycetota bacterium]
MAEGASGPEQVWDLIRRADEFVKYASNRDPNAARARAREFLERAVREAEALSDRRAGEALERQARVRLDDLGGE